MKRRRSESLFPKEEELLCIGNYPFIQLVIHDFNNKEINSISLIKFWGDQTERSLKYFNKSPYKDTNKALISMGIVVLVMIIFYILNIN